MPSIVMIVLVLLALGGTGTAAGAAAAGPTCETEYDRCMKSCRRK